MNDTICLNDLMATVAAIVGAELPDNAGEDSVSFLPTLLGTAEQPVRDGTLHQAPGGDLAIRQGPWKAIFHKKGQRELFDLATDLSETKNVLADYPEVAKRLSALMQSYIDRGRSTSGAIQKNEYPLSISDARPQKKKEELEIPRSLSRSSGVSQ